MICNGKGAEPSPSWPALGTLPFLCQTSGIEECHQAPKIPAVCSSSAITGAAILPNESVLLIQSTISPTTPWHAPRHRDKGIWLASIQ
jgi:hypothetical protein